MAGIRSDRRCSDRRLPGPRSSRTPAKLRDGHTHEKNCLNCGAELAGALLPGLRAAGARPSLARAFCHDFLHGVFNFEGKIWRTLPMLAWRPGS